MQLRHITVKVLSHLIFQSQRAVTMVQLEEEGVDADHTSLESGLVMGKIILICLILHPHHLTA